MKRAYIDAKRLTKVTKALIQKSNEIIIEYSAQGYQLTLRQLYYQFVSRDLIPNTDASYKKLGKAVSDGRLLGMIDWSAIVDRTRNLLKIGTWGSPVEILEAVSVQYKLNPWTEQPYHIEVWIEKDALVGVIERVCNNRRVGYFACRGYVSQSEMWEAGMRFTQRIREGKEVLILHLGDHDPSGIHMTEDIRSRLEMFISGNLHRRCPEFHVERIALNMDQIQQYNPPPNPAKLSDARAQDYVDRFGYESWELDALEPSVINDLIEAEISNKIDCHAWGAMMDKEADDRERLKNYTETERSHQDVDSWEEEDED